MSDVSGEGDAWRVSPGEPVSAPGAVPTRHAGRPPAGPGGLHVPRRGERDAESAERLHQDRRDAADPRTQR